MEKTIREDNTLVILEETGKLDIQYIDEDIMEFMQALKNVTGKDYYISSELGGQFIREWIND